MLLDEWVSGRSGIVSIDADFFTDQAEQQLAPTLAAWLARATVAGIPVAFRDDHVDLVGLVSRPVDFILNFDYHMDCRLEFLHGDQPRIPPCSASVFETLLSDGLTERYVWAFPAARSRSAALAYSSAFVANRQPLLARMHCVTGGDALERILDQVHTSLIFVCRSPDYATADTDVIYDDLRSLAGLPARDRVR
jgi:hypothetical protein